MRIIQCKVNQLWSANPIKAMKAFYDCQTRQVCSEKNDFENDFTDDRHWTTDLNDVREAFYDYAGQVKKSKSVFTPFKKHMQKSLDTDLEKTIERLKICMIHFTSEIQFNQLLDSISRGLCYSNYDTNNNEPPYECGNTFEEFNESLLNDKCKIISELVNCLKMYMDEDEIFKLLDVNSSEEVKTKSCVEYMNTFIKKIFGFILFSSYEQTVQNKPIDSCASVSQINQSQTDCNSKENLMVNKCENRSICKSQTDCNSKGDLMVNKCEKQPSCKSQTDYNSEDNSTTNKCENRPIGQELLQTDAYSSGENLTANKPKIQPCEKPQTQVDNMDCCEVNIKLKETLAEMQKIKDQLLCEKKSKEEAGRQLLLGIRKASLHIKGKNIN